MNFTLLIDHVAERVNVDARLLQQRKALLVDKRPISFSLAGDAVKGDFVLTAPLGRPDPVRLHAVALMLTTANYLGAATDGCTIGLQHTGDLALYWRGRIAQLNGDRVMDAVHTVSRVARYWRPIIANELEAVIAANASSSRLPPPTFA